jgi:hypothetical protein
MNRTLIGKSSLALVGLGSLAASVLLGCDTPVQSLGDTLDTVRVETSEPLSSNAIDILFLVDNSGSMRPFQAELTAQFAELIDVLAALNADFHIAVITTDTGSPTQSGRFLDRPFACNPNSAPESLAYCNDLNLAQPFLAATRYRQTDENGSVTLDSAQLQQEFQCIATQGACGDAFEMGLDAIRLALNPSPGGLLEGVNRDFIREDAFLALILLTDEDDCSPSSDSGFSPRQDADCYSGDNRPLMRPVSEIYDQLVALKGGDPSRILMAGIMGPDDGVDLVPGVPPVSFPACTPALAVPDAQGRIAQARDGERYRTLLESFGSNSVETSICESSFVDALREIGQTIRANLDFNCLSSTPETCTTSEDCAEGVDCVNPGEPGGNKFCADFEVLVEASSSSNPFEFATLVSPGPVGTSEAVAAAQYSVNFDALQCPTGIAFSFNQGERPAPGARFRATYPIEIETTTAGDVLGGSGDN